MVGLQLSAVARSHALILIDELPVDVLEAEAGLADTARPQQYDAAAASVLASRSTHACCMRIARAEREHGRGPRHTLQSSSSPRRLRLQQRGRWAGASVSATRPAGSPGSGGFQTVVRDCSRAQTVPKRTRTPRVEARSSRRLLTRAASRERLRRAVCERTATRTTLDSRATLVAGRRFERCCSSDGCGDTRRSGGTARYARDGRRNEDSTVADGRAF